MGTMVNTNRTNWMVNITMADSIRKSVIDQNFLLSCNLSARNTLQVLNKIKAIPRAWTVMDVARLGRIIVDGR